MVPHVVISALCVGRPWNGLARLVVEAPTAGRRERGGVRRLPKREGVIGMIVIVESEADRIDPELVRHVP